MHTGRTPRNNGGREWSDAFTSQEHQGLPATVKSWEEAMGDPSPTPERLPALPGHTSSLHFRVRVPACGFQPPSLRLCAAGALADCYRGHRGLLINCPHTAASKTRRHAACSLSQEGSVGPSEIQAASPADPDAPGPGRAASIGSLTQPVPGWPSTSMLAPKVNICPQATAVFARRKPQQVFFLSSVISIHVVSKPRSNLVLRKPLKMSQEGQKSQTVAAAQEAEARAPGPGLQGALRTLGCRPPPAAQLGLPGPPGPISCSQLEAPMSSASQGHELTQLMGPRASRSTHVPTPPGGRRGCLPP